MKHTTLVLILACLLLLAACGGAATGGVVSGQALWGEAPVAGATVELRAPDWRATGDETALATAASDETGAFLLEGIAPGEYSVVALWPDGELSAGGTPVVTIDAEQAAAETLVRLERPITLLEPEAGQPVAALPTIRWQPIDGIDTYRVLIIDIGTSAAVVEEMVEGDSLTPATPLEPGRIYTLVISGFGAAGGEPLASVTQELAVDE